MQGIGERRRTGDMGLHPRRRSAAIHDFADSLHGFVRQLRALITGDIHHHVSGFSVGALNARRRQRIPPQVQNMLHMLAILRQSIYQAVVVAVNVIAQRLLTFQDDHDRTIGIVFPEVMTDTLHRLHRRCVCGHHRC